MSHDNYIPKNNLPYLVVKESRSEKICNQCDPPENLIIRLYFNHTWVEFCPRCRAHSGELYEIDDIPWEGILY